jgi:hypothetical protein
VTALAQRSTGGITLSPEEHRVLAAGRVRLFDWHNVAAGYGLVVHNLTRAGLMRADWMDDMDLLRQRRGFTEYTVTRAGRDAFVSYGPPYVPMGPA